MKILTALLGAAVLTSAATTPTTVYMIGDSTMAERADTTKTAERGWGQVLQRFFDNGVTVRDFAVNGRSTKSFIDEGKWDAVLSHVKGGDYVIIQFGHNDEKLEDPKRFTNPYTGYRRNLERFVDDTRRKGATPIVASPIVRRKFNDAGVLVDTHGAYPFVAREVARERGVPFVDLQLLTEDLVAGLGPERSKSLFVWFEPGQSPLYPQGHQDDTHLGTAGATEVARLSARAVAGLPVGLARRVRGVD